MLKDLLTELAGMFAGDVRLSVAVLFVVAMAATVIKLADATPMVGGVLLLLGCLGLLIESVLRSSR